MALLCCLKTTKKLLVPFELETLLCLGFGFREKVAIGPAELSGVPLQVGSHGISMEELRKGLWEISEHDSGLTLALYPHCPSQTQKMKTLC